MKAMTTIMRKTRMLSRRLAWVVPQDGADEGRVFSITSGDVIRRGPGTQIEVVANSASLGHARVIDDGESWLLVNEASEGPPTKIGDETVMRGVRTRLHDGDLVVVGNVPLIFRSL